MNMAKHGKYIHQMAEALDQGADSKHSAVGSRSPEFKESLQDYLSSPASEVGFGYYANFSTAKDILDLKQRVGEEIDRLGFSEYSFVHLEGSGSIESQVLVTFSKQCINAYYSAGLYEHDMIIPYAESKQSPIYRSCLDEYIDQAPFDSDMTRTMQEIYELNKSFGYYDFYNIPDDAKCGSGKVMLSLTARGCTPYEFRLKVKGCESTLKLLCEAIGFVTTRKFPDIFLPEIKQEVSIAINPRPLRVLDTLANNDLNISQVADKLCISVVTANKHLETARKAFSARTNYSAIKQAITNGLIEYRQ